MIRLVTFHFSSCPPSLYQFLHSLGDSFTSLLSHVSVPPPLLFLSFLSHPPCFPPSLVSAHYPPHPSTPPLTPQIRVVERHVHLRCLITSPPPVPPSSHLPELQHIHHFLQPQHISRPLPPLRGGAAPLFHCDKVVSEAYLNDPRGRPWSCCSCVISASVVTEC